jgi:hypothetical protein
MIFLFLTPFSAITEMKAFKFKRKRLLKRRKKVEPFNFGNPELKL